MTAPEEGLECLRQIDGSDIGDAGGDLPVSQDVGQALDIILDARGQDAKEGIGLQLQVPGKTRYLGLGLNGLLEDMRQGLDPPVQAGGLFL